MHVLTSRLPPGSTPAVTDDAAWSVEAHLLAGVFDAVSALIWVTVQAHGGKGGKKPKPLPRPGGQTAGRGQKIRWGDLAGALQAHGAVNSG